MKVLATYEQQAIFLSGLIDKDISALKKIISAYESTLYGIICMIIEDDRTRTKVLYRAVLIIWHDIDQYDPAKQNFFSWIFNITRTCAVEELRTQMNCPKGYIWTRLNNSSYSDILSPILYEIFTSIYYFGNDIEDVSCHLKMPTWEVRKLFRLAVNEIKNHFIPKLA